MRFLILILYICICFGSVSPVIGQAKDLESSKVLLRGVDKVTGRTHTAEAEIGVPLTIANLRITAQRCLKKPPEETPENAAFLLIEEKNKDDVYEVAFNGWMFSSNPALSAMEDPIYDIWVLDCIVDEEMLHQWNEMLPVATPVLHKKKIEIDSLDDLDSLAEEEDNLQNKNLFNQEGLLKKNDISSIDGDMNNIKKSFDSEFQSID